MNNADEVLEVSGETEEEYEPMPLCRPREVAGMINRAKSVYVWVDWGAGEAGSSYLQVKKENARRIVDSAKEADTEIAAAWEDDREGGSLLIGPADEDGEDEKEEEEGTANG